MTQSAHVFEGGDVRRLADALGGPRRILVTGATGFIGRRLVQALVAAGCEVTALVRDPAKAAGLAPLTLVTALDQVAAETRFDAVVNLAGEPISAGRWTLAERRRFLKSRLSVTRDVRRLIARLETRPEVLVSGSAVGWYGLRGDELLDEASGPRPCFSHRLCEAWERAALRTPEVRVVVLRIGLVLGIESGMLSKLLRPFQLGLGGPFGSGRQWMPWITLDDTVRLIVQAMADPQLRGPVNATAPTPVRNRDFATALGRALGRPALLTVPGALLRLALGPFADELLLAGQRVTPDKVLASGFRFDHPDLETALAALLGRRPGRGA